MSSTPSRYGDEQRWRASLERRLRALETKPAGIPVRVDDPPPDSPVKLWLTVDGRLRGRRADTGAIVELQRMATPGPAPALSWPTGTDVYPLTRTATLDASWIASYGPDGQPTTPGTFGHGRALLIGWARGAIETALTALVSIESVQVRMYVHGELDVDPLPLRVGVHSFNPAAPASYVPGSLPATREVLTPAIGPAWHHLDPANWNVAVTGTAGILVDQGVDEHLAGLVLGADSGAGQVPQLRITFRCLMNVGGGLS